MIDLQTGNLITILVVVASAAAGYGGMRNMTRRAEKDLQLIHDKIADMVSLDACTASHAALNQELKSHVRSIRGLENFARWWLAVNGKSPDEIQRILANDGGK